MRGSLPKLGGVDGKTDGSPDAVKGPPEPEAVGGSTRSLAFGEIDLDAVFDDGNGEPAPSPAAPVSAYERPKPFNPNESPPSTRRVPRREMPTRQSLAAVRLAQEETRIAQADALAIALRDSRRPPTLEDEATRIGSFNTAIEGLLEDSRAPSPPTGSGSGEASRDDRVAAMRDLYAQGNADEALVLASAVATDFDEEAAEDGYGGLEPVEDGYGGLEPVEDGYGGLEPVEDGYGGLEPVEDGYGGLEPVEDDTERTALFVASSSSAPLAQLTSRQVPRLLVDPKDLLKLPMDPRAAFLLSHMDGIQSMEEILDVCAMPEADALELTDWLQTLGVITLD